MQPPTPTLEPAPCRGTCEDAFTAAVCAIEDAAGRLGFEVVYIGLRHTRCGTLRASATAARRGMRTLLRRRNEVIDHR